MTSTQRSSAPRVARVAFAVMVGGLLLHLAAGSAGYGDRPLFSTWLYHGIELTAVALLAARAILVPSQRLVWVLLAGYAAATVGGDLVWTALAVDGWLAAGSAADALYYASYPLAYAGVILLLRGRARWFTPTLWLDGLVGALALGAVTAALVLTQVLGSGGGAGALAINVGYVVADLLLLCFVGLAAGLSGWKPGRAWALIGLSLGATATVDAIYSYQEATGHYAAGSVLSTMWPASIAALAFAAWQPPRRTVIDTTGFAGVAMPMLFAALALAVLGAANWTTVTDAAVVLALAALVAVAARGALTHRENLQLLRSSQREALTDSLTGLGNRRRMQEDLERAVADARSGEASTLVFFDLDGFKHYNDTFGHSAGDALLRRLGGTLHDTVAAHGAAYRLGGDEFCVLLRGHLSVDSPLVQAAADALRESGDGFRVGASFGLVGLPGEADQAARALQLADERMYADKQSGRVSVKRQTRDLLMQVLGEREPDLLRHTDVVADHAATTARALGLVGERVDEVARAAEFHDIGKLAIPDSVLSKPGPLDDAEWQLMREHTIIGERILLAAPALAPVAALVRASHERWDGTGYPDRLAGEAIPLGSRIVAVCDAYDAMTADRSYRRAVPHALAIAELERSAGTQFDPAVVEAFTRCIRGQRLQDMRHEILDA